MWTDSNGNEGGNQRYYAYGANRAGSGDTPTDYQFTGQRRDFNSNLYQMGARWYDPYLNRWVQPDTIIPDWYNPQSLNRFSYVRNNPATYNDPTGHCDPDECKWEHNDDGGWHTKYTGNDTMPDRGMPDLRADKAGPILLVYIPASGQTDPSQIVQNDPFVFAPPSDDPFWYLHYGFPDGTIFAYPLIVGSAAYPAGPYSPLPVSGPAAGRTAFRVAGGTSLVTGQSWGPTNPSLFDNPANSLGLQPGNTQVIILRGTVLDPTGITVKPANSYGMRPGGATEWKVPDPTVQIRLTQVQVRTPGKLTVYTPGTMGPRAFWEFITKLFP